MITVVVKWAYDFHDRLDGNSNSPRCIKQYAFASEEISPRQFLIRGRVMPGLVRAYV